MGEKYLRMKDQKPGLVRKQYVAKGEGLKPKVNVFIICVKFWRRGEETNVTQTHHRRGSEGGDPTSWRLWVIFFNFCNFLEKKLF